MTDVRNGSRTYELACTGCSFATEFEGDIDGLYDVIESHKDETDGHSAEHFVEFEVVSP